MLWASRLGVEGDYPEASLEQHQAADTVKQKIGTFKQSRSLPSTYLPLHRWGTGRGLVTPGVRTHWHGATFPFRFSVLLREHAPSPSLPPATRSSQHASAVRSAADQCGRSSRGDWTTCSASRWGGAGNLAIGVSPAATRIGGSISVAVCSLRRSTPARSRASSAACK